MLQRQSKKYLKQSKFCRSWAKFKSFIFLTFDFSNIHDRITSKLETKEYEFLSSYYLYVKFH